MNFIKAAQFIEFEHSNITEPLQVYRKLERIGRLCYKSEGSITELSHEKFLKKIKTNGHNAMIEHHVFVLRVSLQRYKKVVNTFHNGGLLLSGKYIQASVMTEQGGTYGLISGSTRAFLEEANLLKNKRIAPWGGIMATLKEAYPHLFFDWDSSKNNDGGLDISILTYDEIAALPYEQQLIHRAVTVRMICDRGVSHELVRHRPASYGQESTRYCNYALTKFRPDAVSEGEFTGDLTYILPHWMHDEGKDTSRYHGIWKFVDGVGGYCYMLNEQSGERLHRLPLDHEWFMRTIQVSETTYLRLIELGWVAQQARDVLPNSIKTEIYITARLDEWKIFCGLRDAQTAHPQMQELAAPLHRGLIDRNLLRAA